VPRRLGRRQQLDDRTRQWIPVLVSDGAVDAGRLGGGGPGAREGQDRNHDEPGKTA